MMTEATNPDIELYETADGQTHLNVRTDRDTVWLSADQISALFGRDKSTISRHLRNLFADEELSPEAVVADFATTAADGKSYTVRHYNLDVVISVGYRVKSHEGVRFRQWATSTLRQYLIKGAALNQERLEQIGKVVQVLARATDPEVAGVADILAEYLPSLQLLRDYDDGAFVDLPGAQPNWHLDIAETRSVIEQLRERFPHDTLLGNERGNALEGVIGSIYQSFGGQDLYPTVEEKAANLLYLVVKDHPLSDGNKRTAAALFVTFLARNDALLDEEAQPRFTNNALAATTLLVAAGQASEKELMVGLITRMLTGEGK
jgi:prophage maintenance system killer protein